MLEGEAFDDDLTRAPMVGDYVRFKVKDQQVAGRIGARNGTHLRVHYFFKSTKCPRSAWVSVKDAALIPRPNVPANGGTRRVKKSAPSRPRSASAKSKPADKDSRTYLSSLRPQNAALSEVAMSQINVSGGEGKGSGSGRSRGRLPVGTTLESSRAPRTASDNGRVGIAAQAPFLTRENPSSSSSSMARNPSADIRRSVEEAISDATAAINRAEPLPARREESMAPRRPVDSAQATTEPMPVAAGSAAKATVAPASATPPRSPQPPPSPPSAGPPRVTSSSLLKNKANKAELTLSDAMAYFELVKETLGADSPLYVDFLDVMRDMKEQNEPLSNVVARIRVIFKGHSELLIGFNAFLPKDHRIEATPVASLASAIEARAKGETTTTTTTTTPAEAAVAAAEATEADVQVQEEEGAAAAPSTPDVIIVSCDLSDLSGSGRSGRRDAPNGDDADTATVGARTTTLESLAAPSPQASPASTTAATTTTTTATKTELALPSREQQQKAGGEDASSAEASSVGSTAAEDAAFPTIISSSPVSFKPDASFKPKGMSFRLRDPPAPSPSSRVGAAVAGWEVTHAREGAERQLRRPWADGPRTPDARITIGEVQTLIAAEKGRHTQEKLQLEETINSLKETNWTLEKEQQSGNSRSQQEATRLREELARVKQKLEAEKEKTDSLQHALAQSIPFKQALEDAISLHGQEKKALEATINDLADRAARAEVELESMQEENHQGSSSSNGNLLSSPPLSGSSSGSSTRLLETTASPPVAAAAAAAAQESGATPLDPQGGTAETRKEEAKGAEGGGATDEQEEGRKSRFSRSWSSFRSSGNGSTTTTAGAAATTTFFDSLEESECDGVLLKKEKSKMTGAGRWTKKHVLVSATYLEYYALGPSKSSSSGGEDNNGAEGGESNPLTPSSKSKKRLKLSLCYLNEKAEGPSPGTPTFSLTLIENPPYTITLACSSLQEYTDWVNVLRKKTMIQPNTGEGDEAGKEDKSPMIKTTRKATPRRTKEEPPPAANPRMVADW